MRFALQRRMTYGPVILQHHLPVAPWMDAMTRRLPGLQPITPSEWLIRDEAFAGQMALRDDLIARKREDVSAFLPGSEAACAELLSLVRQNLSPDYRTTETSIFRPDEVEIPSAADHPLILAARLIQEDLLVLQPSENQHILTAAVVCFPASWTLSEKIGRPLTSIHDPVDRYDEELAKRIERLLSLLRPGEPLWRANFFRYNDPRLHQPRREGEKRLFLPDLPFYIRVERQTLLRLPQSNAVAFSIHTFMVPRSALTLDQARTLAEF